MTIRLATPEDVDAIHALIIELAVYERAAHHVVATIEQLRDALFADGSNVSCHVAEEDGEVVGVALWFLNFSTWLGTSGVYLEDLYVTPTRRGQGIGMALMSELARLCLERGYGRFQWSVLDWNTPSINFYRSIGAVAMDEWTTYRLDADALHAFVERS
jgi:GNAT superfamily N-acetyltransferase